MNDARYLPSWQMSDGAGAVVVIDVLRAFTTAAYAFAAGATEIYLVSTVEAALQLKSEKNALAIGEIGGRRPHGFDLSNSPVLASRADLEGRTLVVASATARAVLGVRTWRAYIRYTRPISR
jgi:2-phosphosulfolactate phosphatase